MIVLDVEQRTPEWVTARLGIPTASNFSKIITPSGKRATGQQVEKYLGGLLVEHETGASLDKDTTAWMDRGTDLEPDALRYYEFQTGQTVEPVGFILRDDSKVGCSPDGLVGSDGLLEIKCPSPEVHMSYRMSGSVGDTHKPQVQGQLWLCERDWCDVLSYHPLMAPALIRVERDEEYIEKLSDAVGAFVLRLEEAKARL